MLKSQLKFIITIALVLGLSISFQSLIAAWTAPTATPPGVNVDQPINTGSVFQTKEGSFDVLADLGIGNDLTVANNVTTGGTIYTDNLTATTTGLNIDSGDYGMEFNIDDNSDGFDRFIFKVAENEVMAIDDSGDLTANKFIGDGSSLTNLPAPSLTEGHCTTDSECSSSNWVIPYSTGNPCRVNTYTTYDCYHGHCRKWEHVDPGC
jgi:hypothetical protein